MSVPFVVLDSLGIPPLPEPEPNGWEWAMVEIFGHRSHAGRTREEERFGCKMIRIDIPIKGDPANGWTTHYYGGSSIFSYTLTDEKSVMAANKPYEPPARIAYSADEDRRPLYGETVEDAEDDDVTFEDLDSEWDIVDRRPVEDTDPNRDSREQSDSAAIAAAIVC